MSQAYDSVIRLSFDVRAGLVMRQIHHWAALLFIGTIVAHLWRIFFTGAFRRPREINWIIGVTLLLLAIANGFAGYSLPDDLLSGTGLRIAYSIALPSRSSGPGSRSWCSVASSPRRPPGAPVRDARPDRAGAIARCSRPPGDPVAAEAHAVPRPRPAARTTSSGRGCGRRYTAK